MKPADFVHLHNHSDYSLLDGASAIPKMVKRAAQLEMPALALTDHGSLFGAVEFYQEARKAGVKPILGMEAYVTRGRRSDRLRDTAHHLVLLARNEQGFRNLMRLSSLAFLEGFYYKPRVDHEILQQYSAGLIALSACPKGEVASDLLGAGADAAYATAMMYREIFGENYFLEIQNHGLEIEDRIRTGVVDLAARTGLPLVATNDCHYLHHADADAHDVLLCIQTGKNVDDVNRMRYETDQVYFKSADEMRARFAEFPEAMRNTLEIAGRCDLQLNFGTPLLPEFPLPEGVNAEDFLRELAWKALRERFPEIGEEVRKRFDYELDVICRMGFASYFLIVRDFIEYAKSRGIGVGPGRGSVAGSLVAYALRITEVDPLQHGLIFERFLNPERVSMPDIDIDFDDLRRGEVIEYVKKKYGEGNVTQIITFGTMGAKGVVRDVGRALGLACAEVDRIAKLVPEGLGMTLERALELSPDLKKVGEKGPAFERLLRSARALEGLARHASTHAAGVLITPGPLLDYVPLYRQKDESVTTQWDMKSVEKAGLLKMDFLGLRTLSMLDEATKLIAKHRGETIDVLKLPFDDEAAYRVFQTADTVAIFQFESSGMRDYLRKLKPTVFDDLVAMNALYRPGPMENIPYFIDCKHGRKKVVYDHPDLEPILQRTYGVFVYQEQVMQAANSLAKFSMSQADELRRAMGKKKPEEMVAKRAQFIEGCKSNRVPQAKAEKIFGIMEKFAGYAFNRCATSSTILCDAETGERTTIGDLFEHRRSFQVHALGEDWKLRSRRVLDVIWNGRQPVFELKTSQGRRFVATGNHPLRTLDGWTLLEDLQPGDRIAAPRHMRAESKKTWPRYEIIALAGLLSEGNTCHPTSLYFYGNDPVLVNDFAQAIGQFPNTVARIYQRPEMRRLEVCANMGRNWRVKEDAPFGYDCISGNLAVVMDAPQRSGAFQWGESLGLLGKKATQKRVPAEVFELCDADLEVFVGRLWAGDGFFANHKDHSPFYATSSEEFARDVQLLLSRLGILSGVHAKQFKYRGTRRPGFTVHVLGNPSAMTFLERVAPHSPGREAQVEVLREHILRRVGGKECKDTLPVEAITWIDRELSKSGWSRADLLNNLSMSGLFDANRRGLPRGAVAVIAESFQSPELHDLATSDVFWDRVVSIEPAGVEDVYDLTVEHDHNFVADGLIVHNSHSAAYALLAYQSAYLKAHYPAEFMAATLTSEMADSARIVTLIEECRRMKLELLPPDVGRSEWKFTLEEGKIRFGLGAVRNVGAGAVESILAARAAGPFRDLYDLARRLDARSVNRRVLESLVAAGACDSLGGERAALFAAAGRALEQAALLHRERESGQSSLFGGGESAVAVVSPALPLVEPWTSREKSAREKEVLGFYVSEHPLVPLRDDLQKIASHPVAEAAELEDGAEVRLVGLIGEVKALTTRAGKRMAVVGLEDLSGRIECTVFPEAYEAARELLVSDTLVVIGGRIESGDRGVKVMVSDVKPWDTARAIYRPSLHLEVRAEDLSPAWLEGVDEILSSHPGDAEVYLHIVLPDRSRHASRSRRYRVSDGEAVVASLEQRFPTLKARWRKGSP